MIVAGTGHRPPKLGLGYTQADNELLRGFARTELERLQQEEGAVSEVVSGMAQGWDMALAEAALDLGIPLVAAVAFEGAEKKWPADAKERYFGILSRAAEVFRVSDPPYAAWKFTRRDRFMVDRCGLLLALFDEAEQSSGTGITVGYAQGRGRRIRNVWDAWLALRKPA